MPDSHFILRRRLPHTSSPPPVPNDKAFAFFPFRCISQMKPGRCSGGLKNFYRNFSACKKRPRRHTPTGRCSYLILNFLHTLRVRIMHFQLQHLPHYLKCDLFTCPFTHQTGHYFPNTKISFQRFRIHNSPKHIQRIKSM